jgi:hypothetical protein
MYWRGRRPMMAYRKKPRSSEHWHRREMERQRCKVSVGSYGGGALEEESPGKKRKWGVKKDKLPPLPYLYPRSRGRGHGGSAPLPRKLLGTDPTWGHDVGRQF